jgi:hypothetical protein
MPTEKPVFRHLTDHIVPGAQGLRVRTDDQPGAGGANHEYLIMLPDSTDDDATFVARISYQNGPIAIEGINGVTHEALAMTIIDRLRAFQSGPYACRENALALTHFEDGLMWLKKRTSDRVNRQVEGTHAV